SPGSSPAARSASRWACQSFSHSGSRATSHSAIAVHSSSTARRSGGGSAPGPPPPRARPRRGPLPFLPPPGQPSPQPLGHRGPLQQHGPPLGRGVGQDRQAFAGQRALLLVLGGVAPQRPPRGTV